MVSSNYEFILASTSNNQTERGIERERERSASQNGAGKKKKKASEDEGNFLLAFALAN